MEQRERERERGKEGEKERERGGGGGVGLERKTAYACIHTCNILLTITRRSLVQHVYLYTYTCVCTTLHVHVYGMFYGQLSIPTKTAQIVNKLQFCTHNKVHVLHEHVHMHVYMCMYM